MTATFCYVNTACRVSEDIVPPDEYLQLLSFDRKDNPLRTEYDDSKLVIFEPEQKMYICFNNFKRWKLVGKRISFKRASRMKLCQFRENVTEDTFYFTYSSVADRKHFMSFNSLGMPTKHIKIKNKMFLKSRLPEKDLIDDHNRKVANPNRHRHEKRNYLETKKTFPTRN
ncbi:uncharacterized protein LOC143917858 isoform X2 [Arctopsyche grandis]|uniref:uncharacterized protein LOC143917858 isoform X2 n=1 Tax=Arctopsyche grandis TaxID=121162 RepID=UPI00406D8922